MSARRGFSLAEMVVALLLAGIIGLALARLVISQARFVANQDGMLQARSASRAALNVMSSELRAVTPGGILAATTDSITVRVPYAFGVACYQTGGNTVVGLLPGDSAIYKSATSSGYAWRDSSGTWQFVTPATVGSTNVVGNCNLASPAITAYAATGWAAQAYSVPGTAPAIGSLVYFYQRITYAFAPSVTLPGRKALWRRVVSTGVSATSTGASDELVLPFDTGSTFQFLVGSRLTIRSTAPALLDSIRGVRVRLVGQSELTPEGKSAPSRFDLSTNILFRNNAGN
jgi:prepilin-type N-terminal cleavage/methylation domain-containing protein